MNGRAARAAVQAHDVTAADVLNIKDFRALVDLLDGQTMGSLTALAPHNDPFRIDGMRRRYAEWFTEIWNRYGFTTGTHTRRVHYRLVSQPDPVVMPDGSRYDNTVECAAKLNNAARDARHLGLVPADDFVDRRNAAVYCRLEVDDDTPAKQTIANAELDFTVDLPEMPTPPALQLERPKVSPPYHIEIWIEKATMEDVLRPLADEYKINVKSFAGAASLTACVDVVERAQKSGRPCRILYISDFDPAGHEMPVATARKIEHRMALLGIGHLDIQLRPVALSLEQCQRYALPRTPIKESDKAKPSFEARYGEGATELDALEALHPGELRRLLVEEIERYLDPDMERNIERVAEEVSGRLEDITSEVHDQYRDELDDLQERWKSIQEFRKRLVEHWMLRAAELSERIRQDLESTSDVEAEWPTHREANEDPDPLYDANRCYVEQVHRYKVHQGKPVERRASELRLRTCANPECGKPFEGSGKYCDTPCRSRAYYLRKTAGLKPDNDNDPTPAAA